MEVNVTVEDNVASLITNSTKKDIGSVMTEALDQWMKRNLLKCPFDENYCYSNEPCNHCSKIKR